jgi:hypothetical protein
MTRGTESVASDDGWITMHGPKVEHKRRKGEENAAMACGGGKEQLEDDDQVPMARGGGRDQLTDAQPEALTPR